MTSENLYEFTDDNFDQEVLAADLPVVVDLWAPWCGPCRMLTPIISEVAEEFGGKVKVGKLNTDDNPQTAAKYGINSIPTIFFVKNGTIVDRHVGLLAKEPLKEKFNSLIAS